MTTDKQLEDEIESQRAMLQIYLASDMDINKMDYNDVVNYAISDVNEQNVFIGHWKDYAFLRKELKGRQDKEKELIEEVKEILKENELISGKDKSFRYAWKQLKSLGKK